MTEAGRPRIIIPKGMAFINRLNFTRTDLVFAALLAIFVWFQVSFFYSVQEEYPGTGLPAELSYHKSALNLVKHRAYLWGDEPNLSPNIYRPPLYPLALAGLYLAFGVNQLWGIILNNLLLAGLLVIVYLTGRLVWPSAGLLAAFLVMLLPDFLAQANSNQSDLMFVFFLGLFVFFSAKFFLGQAEAKVAILSSLFLGLATLTRPVSLYLWIIFVAAAILFCRSLGLKRLAFGLTLFLAIQAGAIGGWTARNYAVSGQVCFAGVRQAYLSGWAAPHVIAQKEGIDPESARQKLKQEIEADPAFLALEPEKRPAFLERRSLEIMLQNPFDLFAVLTESALFLLSPTYTYPYPFSLEKRQDLDEAVSRFRAGQPGALANLIRLAGQERLFGYLAYKAILTALVLYSAWGGLFFLVFGLVAWQGRYRAPALFLLLTVLYLLAVHSLAADSRYRIPMMIPLALGAGGGLASLFKPFGRRLGF